jgi:predicted  nucleic acid-binding Zn-ribbon protein
LKRANYSDEIAKELSHRWAHDLQGAFDKGWEQGQKKLGKQLADLRAERDSLEERMNNISDDAESELKECYTERDKLKEDLREHGTTQNRLLSANSDIKN